MEETYQIYVKLLDGKHRALNFPSPSIPLLAVKNRIRHLTGIPISQQRLLTGTKQLDEDSSSSLLLHDGGKPHPTLQLLVRLRGGKGGFGSLLRGAATKAGQKKTNNFDACRDMSGRRLRHVNAEKKLEEWKAEEAERKLEKVAEDFIKKKAKAAGKKAGASGEAERYVEKYREESDRCVEAVEKAVREAIGSLKRKVPAAGGVGVSDAKKLKIWMGKRAVGDDSDEDDSDDEKVENEKSVVLDGDNHLGSSKEAEGSLDSVTGQRPDGQSSVGGSSESGSEGEDSAVRSSSVVDNSDAVMAGCESNGSGGPTPETRGEMMVLNVDMSSSEEAAVSGPEAFNAEKQTSNGPETGNLECGDGLNIYNSEDGGALECGTTDAEVGPKLVSKIAVHEESVLMSTDVSDVVKPLNYDEFNSATELEALGMERLKSELQSRGLKCGGTLQERAARVFLLKTTPLEMLPKKLFAKK